MSKLSASKFWVCFVVKAPANAAQTMPTWTKPILTCFYKIDCSAAIHGWIWMNKVPNESRIIVLSCTEVSFVTSFFEFEKFGVKPLIVTFFVNSHCIRLRLTALMYWLISYAAQK